MKSLFLFDRVDACTLTSDLGSATGYPLTNLQDGRYATIWKAGGVGGNVYVQVEFPVAKKIDSFLFVNTNFTTISVLNILIRTSDDGSAWADLATIPSGSISNGLIYYSIPEVTKKFVRFHLPANPGPNFPSPPQIGMLFVGKRVELPGILNNPKKSFVTDTTVDYSLSGLPFGTQVNAGRFNRKFVPDALTPAQELEFIRFLNGVSNRLHPFFLRDADENWNFVRLGQDSVEWANRSGIVSYPDEISLIGEMPGQQFIS